MEHLWNSFPGGGEEQQPYRRGLFLPSVPLVLFLFLFRCSSWLGCVGIFSQKRTGNRAAGPQAHRCKARGLPGPSGGRVGMLREVGFSEGAIIPLVAEWEWACVHVWL